MVKGGLTHLRRMMYPNWNRNRNSNSRFKKRATPLKNEELLFAFFEGMLARYGRTLIVDWSGSRFQFSFPESGTVIEQTYD
jgi:hypothetical protein